MAAEDFARVKEGKEKKKEEKKKQPVLRLLLFKN
jgi:hypothetical protein